MAEQVMQHAAKRWATEYETIYILRPTVDPDDAEKVAKRVQDVTSRMGAKITKVDTWGKRKLAYPIRKHSRGIFVYVRFVAHNDVVAELERNLRLLEAVMRYQTVKVRGEVDLEAVEVDAEETGFERIEQSEEEAEPTTAERLGMAEPEPEPAEASEESSDDESAEASKESSDDDSSDESSDDSSDGDSSNDDSDDEESDR